MSIDTSIACLTSPPTFEPTIQPTLSPTSPTLAPTLNPTFIPTSQPTTYPTSEPTAIQCYWNSNDIIDNPYEYTLDLRELMYQNTIPISCPTGNSSES